MVQLDLGKFVINLCSLEFCDPDFPLIDGYHILGSRVPVMQCGPCPLVELRINHKIVGNDEPLS